MTGQKAQSHTHTRDLEETQSVDKAKAKKQQEDASPTKISEIGKNDFGASWQRHKVEYKEISKMKKLYDMDGVGRVLETMRRHLYSPDLQGAGCIVLADLTANDGTGKTRESILQLGGVQTVLKAMRINLDNEWQQETGCDFLSVIATTEDGVTTIAEAGGVDAAIVAMRVHIAYDGALRGACSLIRSVAGHGTDKKAIVVDDGGVIAVIKAMRAHPSSPHLIATASGALGALAWRNVESKVAVAKAGGIEQIIIGMRDHKQQPDVQENACKALRSIMGNSTEHRNRIARAGGIEAIVAGVAAQKRNSTVSFAALEIHAAQSRAAAKEASALLRSLAAGHPQLQEKIAKAGGISLMVEVLPQNADAALNLTDHKDQKIGLCEKDYAFHKPSNPRPLTRPASATSLTPSAPPDTTLRPESAPRKNSVPPYLPETDQSASLASSATLLRPASATALSQTGSENDGTPWYLDQNLVNAPFQQPPRPQSAVQVARTCRGSIFSATIPAKWNVPASDPAMYLQRPASATALSQTGSETSTIPWCIDQNPSTYPTPPKARPTSTTVVTRTTSASSLKRPVQEHSQRPFSAGHQRFVVTSVSKPFINGHQRLEVKECQLLNEFADSRPVEKKKKKVEPSGPPKWQMWKLRTYESCDLRKQTVQKMQSNVKLPHDPSFIENDTTASVGVSQKFKQAAFETRMSQRLSKQMSDKLIQAGKQASPEKSTTQTVSSQSLQNRPQKKSGKESSKTVSWKMKEA